jgi:PAS domain S-box-containing protein
MQNFSTPEFGVRSEFARYTLAVLAAVAAVLLREMLSPWLGRSAPYLTLWTAVAFSAWYCGMGPSIAAALTGVAGVWFFFFRPTHSLALRNPRIEIPDMIGFLVFAGFIIALGETNRRSKVRLQPEALEREATEKNLRDRQRELHEAQRLAAMGSWTWDPQTNIVTWSEGLYRIRGLDPKIPPPGFPENQKLFTPESFQRLQAAIEHTLQTGEGYDLELEMVRPDGTTFITMTHAEAERGPDGRVARLFGTIQDITKAKRIEETLRKAHDELERRVVERTGELAETVVSLEAEMLERKKTEQDLRLLSARVLRLQDEERRRIARDLHDSTGQTLAALRMSLGAVERLVSATPEAAAPLTEAQELANQALREIRTTSYLLHPPLLDEVGFASAARWYVEGFTSRSGIRADLQLNPVPPLKKEFELALFRILQESLSNVHRHSESTAVEIQLNADAENTILSIRDFGRGMPQRVRELGGHLRVESNGVGTRIIATLPITEAQFARDDSNPNQSQISAA